MGADHFLPACEPVSTESNEGNSRSEPIYMRRELKEDNLKTDFAAIMVSKEYGDFLEESSVGNNSLRIRIGEYWA